MLTIVGAWKWNQVKESKERGLQVIGRWNRTKGLGFRELLACGIEPRV